MLDVEIVPTVTTHGDIAKSWSGSLHFRCEASGASGDTTFDVDPNTTDPQKFTVTVPVSMNADVKEMTLPFEVTVPKGQRPEDALLVPLLADDRVEAYPQGVTKYMGWGAATSQGRYADVYAFASLFTTDAAKKQKYINAVSQYADYSLGLNPMGQSYYTGLGTDQPVSPLQLDSYFTKYGLSDGVSSEHLRKPIGNVPGILLNGPAEGRSGQPYQKAVSDKLFPEWESLPAQRHHADGWSLVMNNEFSTWETIVWNAAMNGFLFDAGSAKSPLTPLEMSKTTTPSKAPPPTTPKTKPTGPLKKPTTPKK